MLLLLLLLLLLLFFFWRRLPTSRSRWLFKSGGIFKSGGFLKVVVPKLSYFSQKLVVLKTWCFSPKPMVLGLKITSFWRPADFRHQISPPIHKNPLFNTKKTIQACQTVWFFLNMPELVEDFFFLFKKKS